MNFLFSIITGYGRFIGAALLVFTFSALFSGCDRRRLTAGDAAPGFAATDIAGRGISLAGLKGRVVVLYFWRNSCCGSNIEQLEGLYKRNKDRGLAILAINEGDTGKDVETFAKAKGLTFTVAVDTQAEIFRRYQGQGVPTIFILDRNGIIREKLWGHTDVIKLGKLVQRQFDLHKEAEASYEKLHRSQMSLPVTSSSHR